MGKKGVKYLRRGQQKKVKVGFYYFEIILQCLKANPEGLRAGVIARRTNLVYNTTRTILAELVSMNRVESFKKKSFKNRTYTHYRVNELAKWEI